MIAFRSTIAKRRWTVFAVAAFFSGLFPLSAPAADTVFRILHFSDMSDARPAADGKGGAAALKSLIIRERARNGITRSIVTFGGGALSPSPLSSMDRGTHMTFFLGAIGVELAVVGNHDFDYGSEMLARQVRSSPFLWLGANVHHRGGPKPLIGLGKHAIRKVGAHRVGFIGLVTEETPVLSRPSDQVSFAPVAETAREQIARLKKENVDVIVALTHQSWEADERLMADVPEIDLILGGHNRQEGLRRQADGRIIAKPAPGGGSIAVADIAFSEADRSHSIDVSLVANDGDVRDETLATQIDTFEARVETMLTDPIATPATALDARRSAVRTRETAMGNLIADAMRTATQADVALVNGGSIRADRVFPAGSVISKRDVLEILPFGNSVAVLELTGAQIRQTLEIGVQGVEAESGQFLQVSGLSFVWDPAGEPGRRVVSIAVAGRPIQDDKPYTVATNDFMTVGGGGFTVLAEAPVKVAPVDGPMVAVAVADYLRARGTGGAGESGRIRRR